MFFVGFQHMDVPVLVNQKELTTVLDTVQWTFPEQRTVGVDGETESENCVLSSWQLMMMMMTGDLNSEFVFSFDQSLYQGYLPSILLFTHSWRKNRKILIFLKGISKKWNANSLIQDLNLGHWFHFIRW